MGRSVVSPRHSSITRSMKHKLAKPTKRDFISTAMRVAAICFVVILLLIYLLLSRQSLRRTTKIDKNKPLNFRLVLSPQDATKLMKPRVVSSGLAVALHPMNHNMPFQRSVDVEADTVQSGYTKLAQSYLTPFVRGIDRDDYMKIMKRKSYSVTPQGANRGLQSILFQIVNQRVYMYDPHDVHKETKKRFYRSRVNEMIWLLSKLLHEGRVPDTEFVLNVHDCVQTVRFKHSYRSATYRESSPSFTLIGCNFSDNIPIPVWEGDAQRGGHLAEWDQQMRNYAKDETAWRNKIGKAVFRGGNRASMYFKKSSEAQEHCHEAGRSRLYYLSQLEPSLFNVSISGHCGNEKYTLQRLRPKDHHLFKYVIYAEGNCMWADRLKTLIFGPSAVVKQETACGMFFEPLLKPFVHYIPTDYFMTDTIDVIRWAQTHESEVQQIVENANLFAKAYMSLSSIKLYVELLLKEYTKLLRNKKIEVEKGAVDVTGKSF